jgi:F-type H+-transporting ATPase subunit delta
MAEAATVARPYAEAVFGLAEKAGALAPWSRALGGMARIASHPDMQRWIANPNLTARQLYDLFMSLGVGDLPEEQRNFVRLLIANDRLTLLPEILAQFVQLKNGLEGVVEAEIRTAFPLDNQQLSGLVASLERRFKRRIQPRVSQDKELIGGVRITVGDTIIDGSVRGKLENMATTLKS